MRPHTDSLFVHARQAAVISRPSNQSIKPTTPLRNAFSVFATTPCRGLSLSRWSARAKVTTPCSTSLVGTKGKITEQEAHEGTEQLADFYHGGKIPAPAYFGERPGGRPLATTGDTGQRAELPTSGRLRRGAGPGIGVDVSGGNPEAEGYKAGRDDPLSKVCSPPRHKRFSIPSCPREW